MLRAGVQRSISFGLGVGICALGYSVLEDGLNAKYRAVDARIAQSLPRSEATVNATGTRGDSAERRGGGVPQTPVENLKQSWNSFVATCYHYLTGRRPI